MTFLKTDLTAYTDLHEHGSGTGAVRSKRPAYVDFLPPCNNACPAGEDIQAWLSLAQAGQYFDAWEKLTEDNPMAAIHGRVCYHPCESSCNRGHVDTSVSIHGSNASSETRRSKRTGSFQILRIRQENAC